MPTEECFEECEILTSIYSEIVIEHDKPIKGESLISMVLYPATGDDETTRHVTVTLEFILPTKYPDVLPIINFRNPRGISDIKLDKLQVTVVRKSEELIGNSMMFQIRDIVQEFLTCNNRPASECPICLLSFTDFDVFYRTDCFHHYHSKCLGTYLQNVITTFKASGEQRLPGEKLVLSCPVCRMDLDPNTDVEKLLSAPPPAEEALESLEHTSLPEDWLGKRETLKALFTKQKQQGGIIDLTEKNKKLLVISDTITSSSATTMTPNIASDSDSRSESFRTTPSVNNSATRKPSPASTMSSTTANTTTTAAHSQGQPRQTNSSGPPTHRWDGQSPCYTHSYGHGHSHHNRHHPHHYKGESRTYYNHNHNNHPNSNPIESNKPGKNTTSSSVVTTTKDTQLTHDSQVKVNTHGHGHGFNRDRRRAK